MQNQRKIEWVLDAWNSIATDDYIMKGFKGCGYYMWDGQPDSLFSRLAETLKNDAVAKEIRDKVDAEIEAMIASIADEGDELELTAPVNESVYDNETDDSDNEMDSQDVDDFY